jgi:hypothetical protein
VSLAPQASYCGGEAGASTECSREKTDRFNKPYAWNDTVHRCDREHQTQDGDEGR